MLRLDTVLEAINRSPDKVLFNNQGVAITGAYFLTEVEKLANDLLNSNHKRWLICYKNSYQFSIALFATLLSEKQPILLANNKPATLARHHDEFDAILSDIPSIKSTPLHSHFDSKQVKKVGEAQTIVLFTSGSTGQPKKIIRSLQHLSHEINVLEQVFGEDLKNKPVYSTVSHQHIYGLLFHILWPMAVGRMIYTKTLESPGEIINTIKNSKDIILISSPTILSRMPNIKLPRENTTIFSAGSMLSPEDARNIYQNMHQYPIEILGSTETGGVAYRQQKQTDQSWMPLPCVDVSMDKATNRLTVQSPFFDDNESFIMGDIIKLNSDGTFQLNGRADRIVKIEGKRISLNEMETLLQKNELIEEAKVIPLQSSRQYIAAVIKLTDKGNVELEKKGKLDLNNVLASKLSESFDNTVLPKRFRYVNKIPSNPQGKTIQQDLVQLFESNQLQKPTVLSLEEPSANKAILTLHIPKEVVYFNGHFNDTPVLPGVAQTNWAITFAADIFDIPKQDILKIEKLKFTRVIKPDTSLSLELIWNNGNLLFTYFNEQSVYSSGKLKMGVQ